MAAGRHGSTDDQSVTTSSLLPYRADIDGLRAVAVLAVFLFHAGVGVEGGYLGVDVFFVISGFLIMQMFPISGTISLSTVGKFWLRRCFRIAPALLVVCAVSSVAGMYLMMPTELKAYGTSLSAAVAYHSNFLFTSQAGYFDAPSLSKPLLHTWSLSLEAQFYLLFPLVLCPVLPHAWLRRLVIVVTLLASFVASAILVRSQPVQAYFLPHTRIWEFLVGVLLTQLPKPSKDHARWIGCLEFVAASMLAVCFLSYSPNTRFPGEMAIPPVLATAALLWSGSGLWRGPVFRCLTSSPMVTIGRISYAFYLWHWPLIVFCTYAMAKRPSGPAIMAILASSLTLAVITRRWIELPFLQWDLKTPSKRMGQVTLMLAAVGLLGGFGVMADRSGGWQERLSPLAATYAAGASDVAPRAEQCHTLKPERILARDLCLLGYAENQPPALVVWGDSHAHALNGAFDQLARRHGVMGLHASYSACPPVLGVEIATHINDECRRFNTAMIEFIEQTRVPVVVLVAYWSIYPLGYLPGGLDMGKAPFLVTEVGQDGNAQDSQALFVSGLSETVRRLTASGTRVYVAEQVPEVSASVPLALARAELFPWKPPHYLQPRRDDVEARQAFVMTHLHALARKYPVQLLAIHDVLCSDDYCKIESAGRSLYRDSNHLSAFGAMQIAPALEAVFLQRGHGT